MNACAWGTEAWKPKPGNSPTPGQSSPDTQYKFSVSETAASSTRTVGSATLKTKLTSSCNLNEEFYYFYFNNLSS